MRESRTHGSIGGPAGQTRDPDNQRPTYGVPVPGPRASRRSVVEEPLRSAEVPDAEFGGGMDFGGAD